MIKVEIDTENISHQELRELSYYFHGVLFTLNTASEKALISKSIVDINRQIFDIIQGEFIYRFGEEEYSKILYQCIDTQKFHKNEIDAFVKNFSPKKTD